MCVCVYMGVCVCMCVCVYMGVCVCMCVCVCVFPCAYYSMNPALDSLLPLLHVSRDPTHDLLASPTIRDRTNQKPQLA